MKSMLLLSSLRKVSDHERECVPTTLMSSHLSNDTIVENLSLHNNTKSDEETAAATAYLRNNEALHDEYTEHKGLKHNEIYKYAEQLSGNIGQFLTNEKMYKEEPMYIQEHKAREDDESEINNNGPMQEEEFVDHSKKYRTLNAGYIGGEGSPGTTGFEIKYEHGEPSNGMHHVGELGNTRVDYGCNNP